MRIHAFAISALLFAGACADADSDTLTFEEFEAQAYQEPDTGFYIVNGDEPARNIDELRDMYEGYLASTDSSGIGSSQHESIVHLANGQRAVWSASQAQNLTYCISTSKKGGFSSSEYSALVNAMNTAAGAWESAGRINFIHNTSQDSNCTNRNNNVVFNIRRVCSGQYLASAFFPNYPRRNREIKVDCTSFGNINPWTLAGIMRHELGHTIGLRHEHTRPESGVCFEDNNWEALTAYDSESVMHYPQCNGTQDGDLVLTTLDRAGAAALYP
jgi:hypothetical protein